jgi:hypothetical protein
MKEKAFFAVFFFFFRYCLLLFTTAVNQIPYERVSSVTNTGFSPFSTDHTSFAFHCACKQISDHTNHSKLPFNGECSLPYVGAFCSSLKTFRFQFCSWCFFDALSFGEQLFPICCSLRHLREEGENTQQHLKTVLSNSQVFSCATEHKE